MRLLTVLLVFTIILFGCENQPKKLTDYSDFSMLADQEVQGFEEVLGFFSEIICTDIVSKKRDVSFCYRQYLQTLKQTIGKHMDYQIPFLSQVEFIESLDSIRFSQIWMYGETRNKKSDTAKVLYINPDGNYADFLKSFAKTNEKVKKYYSLYDIMGTISPTMYSDLLINHHEYDVEDLRIRLLISVHYLTINYNNNISEQLKSLEKKK